jgi:polyisoprenoid-binding protein YceI
MTAGLTGLIAVVFAGSAQAADTYQVDPSHSGVTFSVTHMVISKVKGRFGDFQGMIVYDESNVENSSVEVTIKATSIDTNHEKRDKDLRSAEFFDVENHPEITFKSSKVMKSKDGFVAVGTLTMHGVSKEIEIPFEVRGVITDPWGNTRLGAAGTLTLNRQHFGIKYSQKLDNGGLVVSDEVDIELEIEAIKQKKS